MLYWRSNWSCAARFGWEKRLAWFCNQSNALMQLSFLLFWTSSYIEVCPCPIYAGCIIEEPLVWHMTSIDCKIFRIMFCLFLLLAPEFILYGCRTLLMGRFQLILEQLSYPTIFFVSLLSTCSHHILWAFLLCIGYFESFRREVFYPS